MSTDRHPTLRPGLGPGLGLGLGLDSTVLPESELTPDVCVDI